MKLKIKRFDKNLPLPSYEKNAAGFDFFCRKGVTIKPKEMKVISLNVACEIPKNFVLLIVPRSSTFKKYGLFLANSIGVVDPFYCRDDQELVALFYNYTDKTTKIKKRAKIAQGLLIKNELVKFEEVKKLKKSSRGKWNV